MKSSFQLYNTPFKNNLARIFLPANLIICAVIFNWSEFFLYISKINEKGCKPIQVSAGPSFGLSDSAAMYSDFEFIIAGTLLMFAIFYLPSYILTLIIISAMKSDYPHWCIETFDLIFIPIFTIINLTYLIFLSYFIERVHDYYVKHKPVPKKPLSIYSE